MRVHAIQTGRVQIKASQIVGRGHGLKRRLAPLIDAEWSAWLPVYAYAIEHRDGVILVDSGAVHAPQAPAALAPVFSLERALRHRAGARGGAAAPGDRHWRRRRQARRADPSAHRSRRRARGIPRGAKFWSARASSRGLRNSPEGFAAICRSAGRRISIRNRLFSTTAPMGRFSAPSVLPPTARSSPSQRPAIRPTTCRSSSRMVTRPFFIAGDASYNEATMLIGALDGVSVDEAVASTTLGAIQAFAAARPTIYLPAHDPDAAQRLAERRVTGPPVLAEA